MESCLNCRSSLNDNARFCVTCGTEVPSQVLATTKPGTTIEMQATTSPRWYVTYATGQRGGPFSEDVIEGMISRQELKITDSVVAEGGSTWVPISQSPFARSIIATAQAVRLASSTCPRCGGAMIVVLRRSSASKALLITGLLTIWMFGFGLIFLILGYIVGRNPVPRYECPLCKYKSK